LIKISENDLLLGQELRNMDAASLIERKQKPNIPELAPGDTVRVSSRIVEGEKERLQVFQGIVIKVRRAADGGNFTVRRVSHGIGVERTFPMLSPLVASVEVVRHGKVRRARLFYLRGLSGKAARIKERRNVRKSKLAEAIAETTTEAEPEVPPEEAMPEEPTSEESTPPQES
jgi:large subunit ribosomal protein L19